MSEDWIDQTRERILRDVDPAVVEAGRRSRAEFAERIGNPRRCDTNQVHPADGSCLYCGAWNGETCCAALTHQTAEERDVPR